MATVFSIPTLTGEPTVITLDAVVTRVFDDRARVTEDPIEDGADSSDHYQGEAGRFTLDGILSDRAVRPPPDFTGGVTYDFEPVDLGGGQRALVMRPSSNPDRAQRIYEELRRTQQQGILIDSVTTPRRTFRNVAIISLSSQQSAETGDSIPFRMECRELLVASTDTAEAAIPRRPRGRPQASAGSQTGGQSDEGDEETNQSTWARLQERFF